MKLSAALLLGSLAAALAACPNDCNSHGACNIYSACECYRQFMGADCSERMCAYGKAFVDTPQGDLNADGVVERPDNMAFVLGSTGSFFAGFNQGDSDGSDEGFVSAAHADAYIATASTTTVITFGSPTGKPTVTDYYKGFYITLTDPDTSISETRQITASATDGTTVTVGTAFTALADDDNDGAFDNDGASKADLSNYRIHSFPSPTTKASSYGGCTFDGTSYDCAGASLFALEDYPENNKETYYQAVSAIDATKEITTDGVAVISGFASSINQKILDDCSTKFGLTITNAIVVHARASVEASLTNSELGVPAWAAPDTSTAAGGLVEKFVATPAANAKFKGYIRTKTNSGTTDSALTLVATTGAGAFVSGGGFENYQVRVTSATTGVTAYGSVLSVNNLVLTLRAALPFTPADDDIVELHLLKSMTSNVHVCSPSAGTGSGSTYLTQWAPGYAWESYPSEHGYARNGISSTVDKDTAVNAATGTQDEQKVTQKQYWDEAHFYRECSAKGSCDRSSGKCDCFPGYAGTGCIRLACPNDCSGHGQCRRILDEHASYVSWDFDKTASCQCETGYAGLDCSNRKCPMGDDPITRGSVTEIQTFGLDPTNFDLLSDAHGLQKHAMFALEFTDEMGDKWVTHPIDFTTGNHAHFYDTTAGVMLQPVMVQRGLGRTGATNLQTAFFIGDSTDGGAIADGAAMTTGRSMTNVVSVFNGMYITAVVDTGTTQTHETSLITAYANTGEATSTWTSAAAVNKDWFITTKDYRTDYSLAKRVETALESLPNNVLENVEVSVDTTGGKLMVAVTFSDNSGDVLMLGSRQCWTYAATTTEAAVECNSADGSFGLGAADGLDPFGLATGVANKFTIAETRKGTKENAECSNRGICDYGTGLCKCFTGYTDFDCSIQNSLASA